MHVRCLGILALASIKLMITLSYAAPVLRLRRVLRSLLSHFVVALCCWCNAVAAADFEAGALAYGRGEYAAAYAEWLPLARAGDSTAQFSIGMLYSEGHGVEVDYAEAASWYQRAAAQGVVAAQFTLGVMYAQGIGVPQDLVQSAKWYAQAAEQGDADAQFAFGLILSQGAGLARDTVQSVQWFRRAAIQGHGVAQASLGLMYTLGQGVAQDDVCAYGWFSLAAAGGSARAGEKRDELRAKMTAAQVQRGQSLGQLLARTGACELDAAPALVQKVRQRLRALGYSPGPVGKTTDALTTEAVMDFQRDVGLTPTGRVSEELLMLMNAHRKP